MRTRSLYVRLRTSPDLCEQVIILILELVLLLLQYYVRTFQRVLQVTPTNISASRLELIIAVRLFLPSFKTKKILHTRHDDTNDALITTQHPANHFEHHHNQTLGLYTVVITMYSELTSVWYVVIFFNFKILKYCRPSFYASYVTLVTNSNISLCGLSFSRF